MKAGKLYRSTVVFKILLWRTNLNSLEVQDCFLIDMPQCFVYSNVSATGHGISYHP